MVIQRTKQNIVLIIKNKKKQTTPNLKKQLY